MKQESVYWLDKNIGIPICWILTIHRKISDALRKNFSLQEKQYPARILFVKLVEQGSIVLAYPALKRAETLVGKKGIYFMISKENRPILEILEVVPPENIIEVELTNLSRFLTSVAKGLYRIKKEKIDAVVDMEFFSRTSAIISYLSGASQRVGLHRFTHEGLYRGDLFTHRLIYNPYVHIRIFFKTLIEALTYPGPKDNQPLKFSLPHIDEES